MLTSVIDREMLVRQRDELRAAVLVALRADGRVRAVWEGGSEATGRSDPLSDVDLQVLVDDASDGAAAAVLDEVCRTVDGRWGVRREYRVPEPAWHGHHQRFWQLDGLPDDTMLDVVVADVATPLGALFLEPERHGVAVVHHDPDGLLAELPALDQEAHRARMVADLEATCTRVDMFEHLVTKALERAQPLEAIGLYQRLVLEPLVKLLGMQHRPDTYDFGWRYLHESLPAGDAARLLRLSMPTDVDDIARFHVEAISWLRRIADDVRSA